MQAFIRQFVSGKHMSNTTLHKRMGVKDSNYPPASRIIRDAIEARLIRPHGAAEGSRKDSSCVPFWA